MLLKLGGGAGGSIEISDAPKITFDGRWLGWHLEFYDGILYWECWIFSSGTLTINKSYTADAWGIGGGGFQFNDFGGGSGYTNTATGLELSGSIAITIGAGGYYPASDGLIYMRKGGATKLGNLLSCAGGGTGGGSEASAAPGGSNGSSTAGGAGINGIPGAGVPMCRFGDPDKTEEAGHNTTAKGGNGWLNIKSDDRNGEGYGGGYGAESSYYVGNEAHANAGALVIRIPA